MMKYNKTETSKLYKNKAPIIKKKLLKNVILNSVKDLESAIKFC